MLKRTVRSERSGRGPGRPREFDLDQALDRAIRVFRERGYQAASIGELSEAMDVTAGSIYKAFADKRAVFLAAFERYTSLRAAQVRAIAEGAGTGRERMRDLLAFYAESARGTEGRRGCLVVGSAVELAYHDSAIAARVRATLEGNAATLAGLIRAGHADGSIARHVDPETTARLLACMTQGMRVIGKAGWPLPDTTSTVGLALKLLD
jgi:AcrR family transcriptional regulator